MECYVALEIVSEENFQTLSGIFNALSDGEMDSCYELLSELDEDSVETLQAMEEHHGEYLDALDDVSDDEDEGRVRASFVTGSDGEDFLREILMLFGPHAELARGKVSDGESGASEHLDTSDELDEASGLDEEGPTEEVEDPEGDDFDAIVGAEFLYDKGRVIAS